MNGRVYNIERFSIHDGPGIRTTVFLKGCNLECAWCHSPESLRGEPELLVYAAKCRRCGRCVETCANGAHLLGADDRTFHREKCVACGDCVRECPAGALALSGTAMSIDEVFREVLKDKDFYDSSGGGLTISGGEPLLQREFVSALLGRCRQAGIHTAIETAGHVAWEVFDGILPDLDLVILDQKVFDGEKHREFAGVSNDLIIDNLRRLLKERVGLVIRIPVVPGVNDDEQNMEETARLLEGADNVASVELMSFHRLGAGKYEALDRAYRAADLRPVPAEELKSLARPFESRGIETAIRAGVDEW